jgi:uncharacterized protein (DUF58 family)
LNKKITKGDHRITADLQALIRLQYVAKNIPFGSRQLVNNLLVGRHRSSVRGRGMDFEELRHYQVGDDIRQMDWKITNRTKKPHVRVYVEERERPVFVLVDQRLSMFFGSARAMKSVVAVELAALIGWHTLHRGDRVGALIFNDEKCTELKPRRSQAQIFQYLHFLCEYNESLSHAVTDNPNQLNIMLRRARNIVGHDALIYLISDMNGADEMTADLISQLAMHNNVVLNFVYDPLEKKLPEYGSFAVSDGKNQVEINTSDSGLRGEYELFFEKKLDFIRRLLRQHDMPLLSISTDLPVDKQLLSMMSGGR